MKDKNTDELTLKNIMQKLEKLEHQIEATKKAVKYMTANQALDNSLNHSLIKLSITTFICCMIIVLFLWLT